MKDKGLIFKDLSQRLPYNVKCEVYKRTGTLVGLTDYGAEIDYGNGEDTTCEIKFCKPYLRPMSSMTEKEREEYLHINLCDVIDCEAWNEVDWLNEHHFDYRNFIERGLAIEVTEENNPYKG